MAILRPMSTSEVLDRTFSLYRDNFLLFAGIAVLPALVGLAFQLLSLLTFVKPILRQDQIPNPAALFSFFGGLPLVLLFYIPIYLLGHAPALGATTFAVSRVHLERTITISGAYKKALRVCGRLVGISLLSAMLSMGPFLALALLIIALAMIAPLTGNAAPGLSGAGVLLGLVSFVPGVIFSILIVLRLSLSVPVCLVEDSRVVASLKRSWLLAKGAAWRIFLIYLLLGILGVVLNWALQFSFRAPVSNFPPLLLQIWEIAAVFVSIVLASPVATIAIALVYFDQRVRKEAFDLQLMMESIDGPVPGQSAAAFPGIG